MTYSVIDILSSRSCFRSFRTILREVYKGILDLQLCIPLYRVILWLEAPNKFGKSIPEFGETHSSVLGCERIPVQHRL